MPRCQGYTAAATARASRSAGPGTTRSARFRRAGSATTARAPCRAWHWRDEKSARPTPRAGLAQLGSLRDRHEQVVPRCQLFLALVLVVASRVLDVLRGREDRRCVSGDRRRKLDLRVHLL